jgi:protein subunit release factor A
MVLEALTTVSKRGSVGWLHTISACTYWGTLLYLFYFYRRLKEFLEWAPGQVSLSVEDLGYFMHYIFEVSSTNPTGKLEFEAGFTIFK